MVKEKKISRADLSKRIHSRLSGAIPYRTVAHAVNVIIEQMAKEIIEDRIISARRFGTLSPYSIPGHLAHDLSSGEIRTLPTIRSVKFHPHESFLYLLRDREDRFRGKISAEKPVKEKKAKKVLDPEDAIE
jgi:nucleoid DNA-binding protein